VPETESHNHARRATAASSTRRSRGVEGRRRPFAAGGWFHVPNAIVDRYGHQLGPHALALYLALLRHAGASDQCWPGRRRLMRETRMGKDKLAKSRGRLVELGLITVTPRRSEDGDDDSPMYAILPVGGGPEAAPPHADLSTTGGPEAGQRVVLTQPTKKNSERRTREEEIPPAADALVGDSSSSPIKGQQRGRHGGEKTEKPAKAENPQTDPRVGPVLAYFAERWAWTFGTSYAGNGARDGAIIKGLPADYDVELLCRCIDSFLADRSDAFVADNGWSIPMLKHKLSALVPRVKGYPNGPEPEDYLTRMRRERAERARAAGELVEQAEHPDEDGSPGGTVH
jgi:hypothetical protein